MPNILTVPASGIISFDSRTGTDFNLPNLENSVRIAYDSNGGLNINSYVTGVSGVERFSIDGANGRLFSVTDSLSGLLFSVNDIAGLPIIEAFDNDTVIMGAYNRNDLIITGNSVGIGALPNTGTQKLFVSGNFAVSGTSTFSVRPTVNGTGVLLSGEAAQLPNTIVYTTGNQTINDAKTFSNKLIANSGIDIYFSGDQLIGNIISGNWNNTGIAYTGIQYGIRLGSGVVPSATNSLLNVSVNNTGVFNINGRGDVIISRTLGNSDYTDVLTVRRGTTNVFGVREDGPVQAASFSTPMFAGRSSMNENGFTVRSVGYFGISSSTDVAQFPLDVFLRRDGPGIFAQHNGANPQQYRIYNATGTNSGEFATIGWSGNTFLIAPERRQSGINRNLEIHAAGFGRRIIVANNGQVGIGTSAGDQSSHGIWVNPAAGQTSITHDAGQVYVNALGVMFNSNTRVFNNNAFTFGISQNSTIPMIQGSTGIIPNIQVLSSNGLIFGGLDAARLRVYGTTGVGGTSGEFGFLGWSTGVGISPTFVVGPQQTNSGILRDLTITGANINIIPSANITFNRRPLVSGIPVSLIGDDSAAITGLDNKINSLSGNATVLRYGDQIIDGIKTFRDTVYIKDLYVTGAETIVNTTVNNVQDPFLLLNLTGGALDGGIFFVTGVGLTGVNDYGPIIGYDNNNKFKFGVARRSDDLSVLNDIASVQDFTNYSGFINTNLQKLEIALPIGIDMYTGTFNTTFSATPTVVATIRATGLFNYVTTMVSTTISGFVTDFSDVIEESGVTLNIIAYNNF